MDAGSVREGSPDASPWLGNAVHCQTEERSIPIQHSYPTNSASVMGGEFFTQQ